MLKALSRFAGKGPFPFGAVNQRKIGPFWPCDRAPSSLCPATIRLLSSINQCRGTRLKKAGYETHTSGFQRSSDQHSARHSGHSRSEVPSQFNQEQPEQIQEGEQ